MNSSQPFPPHCANRDGEVRVDHSCAPSSSSVHVAATSGSTDDPSDVSAPPTVAVDGTTVGAANDANVGVTCDESSGAPQPRRRPPPLSYVPTSPQPIHTRVAARPPLLLGPEREIRFHTDSLGIKLARSASDGMVRILAVTPYRPMGNELVREGDIKEGDVVREIAGVNLRRPIDGAVWKLTVGLIKMAPRPLEFMVSEELRQPVISEEAVEDTRMETRYANDAFSDGENLKPAAGNESASASASPVTTVESSEGDGCFGPDRTVLFYDSSLGVKIHHDPQGYVRILAVTPYKSFPDSPRVRTGTVLPGDFVREVGGVWNVRDPISDQSWATLVRFIREGTRPLSMVVAAERTEEDSEQKEGHDKEKGRSGEKGRVKKSEEDEEETGDVSGICQDMNQQLSVDALQKELATLSAGLL